MRPGPSGRGRWLQAPGQHAAFPRVHKRASSEQILGRDQEASEEGRVWHPPVFLDPQADWDLEVPNLELFIPIPVNHHPRWAPIPTQ